MEINVIRVIVAFIVVIASVYAVSLFLPEESFRQGDIYKAQQELIDMKQVFQDPPQPLEEPEEQISPPQNEEYTTLNNISENCEGIIEDGYCIKKVKNNDVRPQTTYSYQSMPSASSLTASFSPSQNNILNETDHNKTKPQPSVNYKDIINKMPEGIKKIKTEILGSKEEFEELFSELEEASNEDENIKMRFEEFQQLFQEFDKNKLFKDDLLKSTSISIAKKTTTTGKIIGSFTSMGKKFSNFGSILTGSQSYYSPYEDKSEPRIDYINVVEKADGTTKLRVYFPSYFSMYAYALITPLSIYLDQNNDGNPEVIITLNPLEVGKYTIEYTTTGRKEIKKYNYDTDKKYIEVDLPFTPQNMRFWLWIGEKHTRLRYPKHNNLYYSYAAHSLIKNTIKYTIISIEEIELKEDGDWFFNGESYINAYMLTSPPLKKLLNDTTIQYLQQLRSQGKLPPNKLPEWLTYYVFKGMVGEETLRRGIYLQTSTFPMLKWWSINEHATLMKDDWVFGKRSYPIFAAPTNMLDDTSILYLKINALDDDTIGKLARDLTYWGIKGIIAMSTSGASEGASELIESLVELAYYGASGEQKDMDDIFKDAIDAIYDYLGRPDRLGSVKSNDKNILEPGIYYLESSKMKVKLKVEEVEVPTVPLKIKAKLNHVKIKDRSDYLRGEYYLYARLCSDYGRNEKGVMMLRGGKSISYPRGKEAPCSPEHTFSHGHKKVWDGDKVAKNFEIAEIEGRGIPFVYLEINGWDEDKESIGDNDDSLGIFNYYFPLNEKRLSWKIEKNKPSYLLQRKVDLGKSEIDFILTIN